VKEFLWRLPLFALVRKILKPINTVSPYVFAVVHRYLSPNAGHLLDTGLK
jgi:hypothetical protein